MPTRGTTASEHLLLHDHVRAVDETADLDEAVRGVLESAFGYQGQKCSACREFMAETDKYEKNDVYTTIDQRLKGDDDFVDRILEQHDKETVKPWKHRLSLDVLAAAIEKSHQVTLEDLRSSGKSKMVSRARKVFSVLACDKGYKAVEIGRYLDKDPSRLTTYLRERGEVENEVKDAERVLGKN